MAEEPHHYHIEGSWTGKSESGSGRLSGSSGEIPLDYPVHLGGHEGKANPEELLLQAVAGCYMLTLVNVAERKRLPITKVEIGVGGEVIRQPGGVLKFQSISLRPKIYLTGADDSQRASTLDLAHKAELYCPISNAVRGNVELAVEPEIVNS